MKKDPILKENVLLQDPQTFQPWINAGFRIGDKGTHTSRTIMFKELVTRYRNHISAPWQRNLAGDQKTIFVVYPKEDERKLRTRLELFEMATKDAEHKWRSFNFTKTFATWMANTEYRDLYFESPEDLTMKLQSGFLQYAAQELRKELTNSDVDAKSAVAVHGVASLYGFTKASLILKEVIHDIRGRLLLFFPGEFENNNYRLLDARDGWNYHKLAEGNGKGWQLLEKLTYALGDWIIRQKEGVKRGEGGAEDRLGA